ncbi:MAG: bifunctional metallophosphatase/5'-nucleotidase [Deltaproteobacteria bacterium]|nr:bifunctional metallophosphatase/5'-nucleotidase [Deltaproteobacteria bacterium]
MANSIRSEDESVLLVDCGALFGPDRLSIPMRRTIAGLGMQAMEKMRYAAMNLGREDFTFGPDFVKKISANVTFPIVTSNILYRKDLSTFGRTYAVIKIQDVNVGILGIIPENAFEGVELSDAREMLEITPPKEALSKLIPAVKKEADIIVLLSQCGLETTRSIVDTVDGISLAIVGEGNPKKSSENEAPAACGSVLKGGETGHDRGEKTLLLQAAPQGHSLGFARLTLNESGRIMERQVKMIPVDKSTAKNEEIFAITGDNIYKRISEISEEATKAYEVQSTQNRLKIKQEIEKEREENRNLSPEEYIKLQLEKRFKVGGAK